LSWPTVTPSAPYYRVWRLKVTAKGSAINTCTMGVGGTDASYVTFSTAGAEASAVAADLAALTNTLGQLAYLDIDTNAVALSRLPTETVLSGSATLLPTSAAVSNALTNINGANITVGTITTNALDATADAAYRGGGGGGAVTQWWDSVHAESVGLAVGPAQPSSYVANLVYGSVTQQLEYLAFDDTTEEYTGAQTKVWPFASTTLSLRGATWYTDATPDADWSLWYVVGGAVASEIVLNPTVAAAGVTNLDTWAVATNWTGVSQGDAVTYWISRDVGGDAGTGDNYLRNIELYGVSQ